LNRLNNILRVLGALHHFCCEFYTASAKLIDFINHVLDGRAMQHNALGAIAKRAKHGGNTKAYEETETCSYYRILHKEPVVGHNDLYKRPLKTFKAYSRVFDEIL
jgi:hypothetical protein